MFSLNQNIINRRRRLLLIRRNRRRLLNSNRIIQLQDPSSINEINTLRIRQLPPQTPQENDEFAKLMFCGGSFAEAVSN